MIPAIDLSAIPVVDNHCHGLYPDHAPTTVERWRAYFTESYDPEMRSQHAASTAIYRRVLRAMATFHGCPPEEAAVIAARNACEPRELTRDLLLNARIETLIVDRGFPPDNNVLPDAAFGDLAGVRTAPLLRLEVLMQDLIARYARLDQVRDAYRAALADVRAQGYVGLKSIVAYRTGLAVRPWPEAEVEAAFSQARREVAERGRVRIAHQPLLDSLLYEAFAIASAQELPFQFHTGYGDTDADLLLANPLHLRPILQDPAYRGMRIVLLHESYPYTAQGAYLAAVYGNVYLDLSYGLPGIGYVEMREYTRTALAVAPFTKIMYSSDGAGIPELHWSSAHAGRRAIGEALGAMIACDEIAAGEAEAAGALLLRENANRVYGLV
jgi:hypothetical protein